MIQILKDSGWRKISEIQNKGIADYEREVVFGSEPFHDEFVLLLETFRKSAPGNFPVTARQLKECHYIFYSTYDSSD